MNGITKQIEHYKNSNELTYIEAFIDFCEEKEIDLTEVINEVDKPLKNKITAEFEQRGYYMRLDNTADGEPKWEFKKKTSHLDEDF